VLKFKRKFRRRKVKDCGLTFVQCVVRRSGNDQQYALTVPLLYFIYWYLHVSAEACYNQGTSYEKSENKVPYYCHQITSPSDMSLYSLTVQTLVASASTKKVTVWEIVK
jgi:hypothetical protein